MESFDGYDNELSDNENLLEAVDLFEDDDDKSEEDIAPVENEASEEGEVDKGRKSKPKLKETKKRVVRNPRVSLNFQRLKSEYGLPALNETFEKFKFKGKHHEIEDLSSILQNLQHWMCHTLYPGFDFETCLKTLENLGRKRVVQTHMKKLRIEARDNICNPIEVSADDNEGHNSSNENDL